MNDIQRADSDLPSTSKQANRDRAVCLGVVGIAVQIMESYIAAKNRGFRKP